MKLSKKKSINFVISLGGGDRKRKAFCYPRCALGQIMSYLRTAAVRYYQVYSNYELMSHIVFCRWLMCTAPILTRASCT